MVIALRLFLHWEKRTQGFVCFACQSLSLLPRGSSGQINGDRVSKRYTLEKAILLSFANGTLQSTKLHFQPAHLFLWMNIPRNLISFPIYATSIHPPPPSNWIAPFLKLNRLNSNFTLTKESSRNNKKTQFQDFWNLSDFTTTLFEQRRLRQVRGFYWA